MHLNQKAQATGNLGTPLARVGLPNRPGKLPLHQLLGQRLQEEAPAGMGSSPQSSF